MGAKCPRSAPLCTCQQKSREAISASGMSLADVLAIRSALLPAWNGASELQQLLKIKQIPQDSRNILILSKAFNQRISVMQLLFYSK